MPWRGESPSPGSSCLSPGAKRQAGSRGRDGNLPPSPRTATLQPAKPRALWNPRACTSRGRHGFTRAEQVTLSHLTSGCSPQSRLGSSRDAPAPPWHACEGDSLPPKPAPSAGAHLGAAPAWCALEGAARAELPRNQPEQRPQLSSSLYGPAEALQARRGQNPALGAESDSEGEAPAAARGAGLFFLFFFL